MMTSLNAKVKIIANIIQVPRSQNSET